MPSLYNKGWIKKNKKIYFEDYCFLYHISICQNIYYQLQGFVRPFLGGTIITFSLNLVRAAVRTRSIKMSFLLALFKHRFDLATFLSTYGGVFKVCFPPLVCSTLLFTTLFSRIIALLISFILKLVSCLLRGVTDTNSPRLVGISAAFLAGYSSMSFYDSTSISIYTAWKTIDVTIQS